MMIEAKKKWDQACRSPYKNWFIMLNALHGLISCYQSSSRFVRQSKHLSEAQVAKRNCYAFVQCLLAQGTNNNGQGELHGISSSNSAILS